MRICLVHNYYQHPGGEDIVFANEKQLLQANGHEIIEYLVNNDEVHQFHKVKIALETIWSNTTYRKLLRVLQTHQPDIVHFHNTFMRISPAAYYACSTVGIPVVQTLHNYRLVCPAATLYRQNSICEKCLNTKMYWPSLQHGCYHDSHVQTTVTASMLTIHHWLQTWQTKVQVYIALTDFAKDKFVQGGLPEENIVVKPNFIYTDPGFSTTQGEYALFVGRLSSEKGIRYLLQEWCKIPHIPLKVVGDGPLYNELAMLTTSQPLVNVELLGHRNRNEVFQLMKQAAFLVFPSEWYEPFGLTIIEAYACGRPVIAANLGAMSTIVENGRTGLHFDFNLPNDLVSKIEWAWTHKKEIQEMGKTARRQYEGSYSAVSNYKQLLAIYERARVTH